MCVCIAEMEWIRETYNLEKCREWTEHAKTIQAQVNIVHVYIDINTYIHVHVLLLVRNQLCMVVM